MIRIVVCVLIFSASLYLYLHHNNEVTELRYELPDLADEILLMQEKITTLRYDVEHFESPSRLMELHRKPEFAHLKHPHSDQVVVIDE